jgi:hypothetical protein
MARFLLFLLLLIAGWALIFLPLASEYGLSLGARPAADLPQPWRSGALVQVLPQGSENGAAEQPACAGAYTVQEGESLGEIAGRCEVPLLSLLTANPQIANPNQVAAGERISIPALAGRGGGDDLAEPSVWGSFAPKYAPGEVITVQASGFPPNVPVRVGIGLSSSGYQVLEQATSAADGGLEISLTLPASARPGDTAFILVTASGVPSVQAISPGFRIE